MRATLVAGLPGAGKTTLSRSIADAEADAALVDDPRSPEELLAVPEGTRHLVACHPDFCIPRARDRVEGVLRERWPDIAIEWIFMSNAPRACLENVRRRADGRRVDNYIRHLSQSYVVPEGAACVPAYGSEQVEPPAEESGQATPRPR